MSAFGCGLEDLKVDGIQTIGSPSLLLVLAQELLVDLGARCPYRGKSVSDLCTTGLERSLHDILVLGHSPWVEKQGHLTLDEWRGR